MAPGAYSFIDIAVLEVVRTRLAAGDALAILGIDLDRVIWANGPGAEIFGHSDVESVMGSETGLSPVARRQLASAPGFPRMRRETAVTVRLGAGLKGQPIGLLVSGVTLPDGEPAILIALPATHGAARTASEIARQAVSGFSEADSFAALIDENGQIEAASEGFSDLGIPSATVAGLVEEVRDESDRLVKRLIAGGGATLAAGIARLTDSPARHLLLVVEAEAAVGAAPAGDDAESAMAPEEEFEPETDDTDATGLPPIMQDEVASAPPEDQGEVEIAAISEHDVPASEEEQEQEEDEKAAGAANVIAPPKSVPSAAVRFVWRTDADGRFTTISEEFAEAVGSEAASVTGRSFREVAEQLGLDQGGEIAGLLERRDTWSGRTVLWPIAGTDLRVPVDLAALPIYDRVRNFEGFRGFGVARMGDAVVTPHDVGTSDLADEPGDSSGTPDGSDRRNGPEAPNETDPFRGESPALVMEPSPDRRHSDKVIRLAEHRAANGDTVSGEDGLSPSERLAFRQIGERLKRDSGEGPANDTQPKTRFPQDSGVADGDGSLVATDGQVQTGESDTIAGQAEDSPPAAVDEIDRRDETAPGHDAADGDHAQPASNEGEDVAAEPPEDEWLEADRQPAAGAEDSGAEASIEPVAAGTGGAIALEQLKPVPELERRDFLPSAFHTTAAMASEPSSAIALLAGLPLPALVHAGDTLHFANREFLKLTGHDSLGSIAAAGGLGELFLDGGDPARGGAMRLRRRDGQEADVCAHLHSIAWEDGKALLLTLKPVETEAPASTDDASDLEARLDEMRAIIDTATDGVVLIDNDGNIRSISRPAEALFGIDSAELEGQSFSKLFAIESQRSARDYLAGLADNGVASVLNDGREVIGREAQGRFIPLFMTMGRLPGEGGYCAVLRDITNWKRAEEELTQARSQAERASSQKTEFLARVSHEVRTPLNAIIGFSELMLDEKFGPVGNERYRDYLRDINRSGNHVLDLVNDLLDISKIEAGEQEMSYEAVSLNEALAETVAMMQPQANRERVIIRSSFASRLPEVVADLRSIRQIALNLLSNAVRHTPAGGQVIVSTAYEASGGIAIRFRDTGIGMTLPEIEQALKPFKQINALQRARGDGTGLGLPLTKALVEANRARFSISSAPGQGTLVEITFPSTRVLAD